MEERDRSLILRYYPGFARRDWGNPRTISARIAGLQAGIWCWLLRRKSMSINHSTSTFSAATAKLICYPWLSWGRSQSGNKFKDHHRDGNKDSSRICGSKTENCFPYLFQGFSNLLSTPNTTAFNSKWTLPLTVRVHRSCDAEKIKLSSDGGKSGSKKCIRGYGGAMVGYGGVCVWR
jgi:hypothetical protein